MQTITDARHAHLEGKLYNLYRDNWPAAEPARFGSRQFDGMVVAGGLVRGHPTTEIPMPKPTGGITLVSSPINDEIHSLRVIHARYGSQPEHTNFLTLEFICQNNSFSSPIQWQFQSKIAGQIDAPAFPSTFTEGSCCIEDGFMVMETANSRIVKPIQPPYTHQYCLMEALSLYKQTEKTVFSQIYDENVILPKQVLAPFNEDLVYTGGHKLFVQSLSLTGPGTLPLLLVCNEQGQLIYTQNGFELYALQ
ncbi:MAG: hypothetical protein SCM11_01500 [Bacillota bacterium]|nr:hypothetical protein [Bacillota bacterium]